MSRTAAPGGSVRQSAPLLVIRGCSVYNPCRIVVSSVFETVSRLSFRI